MTPSPPQIWWKKIKSFTFDTRIMQNLSGYDLGKRDINLAACVELIHSATFFMMM